MKKPIRLVVPVLALLVAAVAAYAGGWATITLHDFPDYAVAGTPLKLTFTVRQHGVSPLTDLKPTVRATTTAGLIARGTAGVGGPRGEYSSSLTLPQPGDWTIIVDSGFLESTVTLPSLKVIATGAPTPAPFALQTRGLRLFSAKGCVGCHTHLEVNPRAGADAKMNLTGKRFEHGYLKSFLADPSIRSAEMPNLNLKPQEIEALAAFINKMDKKSQERP